MGQKDELTQLQRIEQWTMRGGGPPIKLVKALQAYRTAVSELLGKPRHWGKCDRTAIDAFEAAVAKIESDGKK